MRSAPRSSRRSRRRRRCRRASSASATSAPSASDSRRTSSCSTTTSRSRPCSWEARRVSSPEPAPRHAPGELFLGEIHEQPHALLRLLDHDDEYARVAAVARERGRLVRFVGHGSSDNAATYGVYAFGLLARTTAVRDSIALSVYFNAEPEMSNSTVVALSQSGRTPDVV